MIYMLPRSFGLNDARYDSRDLPGGYKQRYPWAALMHESKFFLDEPKWYYPLTRRNFWRQITSLSKREQRLPYDSFMDESEYCDRIMIQDAGKLVVLGTPTKLDGLPAMRIVLWMKRLSLHR